MVVCRVAGSGSRTSLEGCCIAIESQSIRLRPLWSVDRMTTSRRACRISWSGMRRYHLSTFRAPKGLQEGVAQRVTPSLYRPGSASRGHPTLAMLRQGDGARNRKSWLAFLQRVCRERIAAADQESANTAEEISYSKPQPSFS